MPNSKYDKYIAGVIISLAIMAFGAFLMENYRGIEPFLQISIFCWLGGMLMFVGFIVGIVAVDPHKQTIRSS